jgi:hypothetical protein
VSPVAILRPGKISAADIALVLRQPVVGGGEKQKGVLINIGKWVKILH